MGLNDPITSLPKIGPAYAGRLEKLGIFNVRDLFFHIPHRYLDFSSASEIRKLNPGDLAVISGELTFLKNQYTRSGRKIQIGEVTDKSGAVTVVWFNQPFLVKTLFPGDRISLAGKVDWFGRKLAVISPEYEIVKEGQGRLHTFGLVPVYPETYGLSSKWLRSKIKNSYETFAAYLKEYLPPAVLTKADLVSLPEAIKTVHFPQNLEEVGPAKKRLAFEELLRLELASLKRKSDWEKHIPTYRLQLDQKVVTDFTGSLPFALTPSQNQTISEILADLAKDKPMNRLLEGDVGSGKTVVAAIASLVVFANGYQTVLMAPTQILAFQHYHTLKSLFAKLKVRVSLVTSSLKKADLGKTDIFVGTHALLQKETKFDKVALVVIDEQHRFGVKQRAALVTKSKNRRVSPHILTMTATPIPRTVSLTIYGDLDLSALTDMPQGRRRVATWIVPDSKREKAYVWVKSQITAHHSQVFVVCPLINESDKETMQDVKAVTKEYASLTKIFKGFKLGLLHGKIASHKKEAVIDDFKSGRIDILVTTPVVEVGIDIPNARIMIIEAAERFGLAQLHQLRGRVGRSEKKSQCLLFTESKSPSVADRLAALQKYHSGFELAELDLKLRGPGEVWGLRQHGFPDLKIATWQDSALIKKARDTALGHPELFSLLRQGEVVS